MIHKAKKSLGQNFLKSNLALSQIVEAGSIDKKDIVLEIGPGKGALTEKLLDKAGYVIAIEKDRELVQFLKEKFSKEIKKGKLILIEEDILDFSITTHYLLRTNYKLIANIPYNITGAIFKKFLTQKNIPQKMVLLVQKEVAERIVARDGKESILSMSIKAYGIPKYIAKVSRRYFSPSPKVDSAIIEIANISKNKFKNKKDEDRFFELVKTGFAHKRKVLIKNLEKIATKSILEKAFKDLNIPKNYRAENLSLDDWLNLLKKIQG